jgi:anaerobic ribonucleoside-triphosphate reductase
MMTPYANPTTTIQVCQTCGAGMEGRETCPTCGGALETVTVELVPVKSAAHIKRVLTNYEIDPLKRLTNQTV